jgi:ribosomal protein S18 acetylase RimI-like enzyme
MFSRLFSKKCIKYHIFFILFLGGGVICYKYNHYAQHTFCAESIVPFDLKRDMNNVVELFKDNWYWLIASKEYDVPFMLTERSPSKTEFQYYGKLILKVIREDTKFKGFLAYYPKNFYTGQILFVAIKKEFRGQGYAQKLVQCALNDLKAMGLHFAKLLTRVENFPAQAVYKKAGFHEVSRDKSFVYFEKSL